MIDTLLRKMDVSENDLLYYHYGLVTVLETASVQLFCIFWTAFRNQLTDYLIFYIIFLLMRKYGGGFHFRDFLPCFITSILSLRGILELLQYIRLEILPCTLISSLSLLFIFLIAPVPSIAEDFTTEELRIRNGSIHNFSGIYKTKTSASPFYDNSSVYIQYHGSRKNTHFLLQKNNYKRKNR